MRRTLLFALLAVLAVTALGIGSAAATAQTISFADGNGTKLNSGAKINSAINDAQMDFGSGFNGADCLDKSTPGPIEFPLEMLQNGPGSVKVEVFAEEALPPFRCEWSGGGFWFPWDFENLKLSVHEFFPNGEVDYSIESAEMTVYGWQYPNPWGTCYVDPAKSSGGGTWFENGAFNFENYMDFPESGCGGFARMYGTVKLTDNEGQPIQIQVQP